jgi:hypothetical protein
MEVHSFPYIRLNGYNGETAFSRFFNWVFARFPSHTYNIIPAQAGISFQSHGYESADSPTDG